MEIATGSRFGEVGKMGTMVRVGWLWKGTAKKDSFCRLAAFMRNVERVLGFTHMHSLFLPSTCPCFVISDIPYFLSLT